MTKNNSNNPVEGRAYTIHLLDFTVIHDAVYHHCTASGLHYFAKGDKVFPIEQVFSHSMKGHPAPPEPEPVPTAPVPSDPHRLVITEDQGETIDVITTPEINPEIFRRRVQCLMISGLSQEEAEIDVAKTPMQLELFYDVGLGGFAIDAEAVGNATLYNPYTGQAIEDKT